MYHEIVHHLLGYRLYYFLISYRGGFSEERNAVEDTLRRYRSDLEGVSIYDVLGSRDLVIRAWLEPQSLLGLRDTLLGAVRIRSIEVYRVDRCSTPAQRACDLHLDEPWDPTNVLMRAQDSWCVSQTFQKLADPSEVSPGVRFFVLYPCSRNTQDSVYRRILELCQRMAAAGRHADAIPNGIGDFALYECTSDETPGVLLSGSVATWSDMQDGYQQILEFKTDLDQTSSTLIQSVRVPE